MAGSGGMKRKSVQKRLREIRAQATTPLNWIENPGWLFGAGQPSILLPYDDVSGRLDHKAMAAVSRPEYLELVADAVDAGEFSAWCDPEASWLRYQRYLDGEHGGHCGCDPCAQKKPPAPPPTSAVPVTERYGAEGVNRRVDLETPTPDGRHEAEQERYRRAWADPSNHHFFTE